MWAEYRWDETYGKGELSEGCRNHRRLPGGGDFKLGVKGWVGFGVIKVRTQTNTKRQDTWKTG